jgi:hypothetical protein
MPVLQDFFDRQGRLSTEKRQAIFAWLRHEADARATHMQQSMDAAIDRSIARLRSKVSLSNMLVALIRQPAVATALKKAGIDAMLAFRKKP